MTQDHALSLIQHFLNMVGIIAGPPLVFGMVVGLTVAVIQSATQLQDSSLNFVPKLLVLGFSLAMGGSWAVEKLVTFTDGMLQEVALMAPSRSPK